MCRISYQGHNESNRRGRSVLIINDNSVKAITITPASRTLYVFPVASASFPHGVRPRRRRHSGTTVDPSTHRTRSTNHFRFLSRPSGTGGLKNSPSIKPSTSRRPWFDICMRPDAVAVPVAVLFFVCDRCPKEGPRCVPKLARWAPNVGRQNVLVYHFILAFYI